MWRTGSLQHYNPQRITAADIPAIITFDSTGLKVATPAPFAMQEPGSLSMNAQGAMSMPAPLAGTCCTRFRDEDSLPKKGGVIRWGLRFLEFPQHFERGSLQIFFLCMIEGNFEVLHYITRYKAGL